jgi:hypothetical protein
MPLFPEGYGQGSGLSLQHGDFIKRMNALAIGGYFEGASFGFAMRVGQPFAQRPSIKVDPVNGDDAPLNDGLVTPLKTIGAMARRLPLIPNGALVDLAAGDYPLEDFNYFQDDYWLDQTAMGAELSSLVVRGAVREHASFEVDAYHDNSYVSKDAGTPAWTPGQWVGYYLRGTWSFPYLGGNLIFTYDAPIWANDAHELTLAVSYGLSFGLEPAPGMVMKIVEPASRIIPSAGPMGSKDLSISGNLIFRSVVFDGFYPYLYNGPQAIATFMACKFMNASYGVLGTPAQLALFECWFENCTYNAGLFSSGRVYASNPVIKNCGGGLRIDDGGQLDLNYLSAICITGTPEVLSARYRGHIHDGCGKVFVGTGLQNHVSIGQQASYHKIYGPLKKWPGSGDPSNAAIYIPGGAAHVASMNGTAATSDLQTAGGAAAKIGAATKTWAEIAAAPFTDASMNIIAN